MKGRSWETEVRVFEEVVRVPTVPSPLWGGAEGGTLTPLVEGRVCDDSMSYGLRRNRCVNDRPLPTRSILNKVNTYEK